MLIELSSIAEGRGSDRLVKDEARSAQIGEEPETNPRRSFRVMINKLKLDTPYLGPIETWRVDRTNGSSMRDPQSDLDHEPGYHIRNVRDRLVPVILDLLLYSMNAVLERRKAMYGVAADGNSITAASKTTELASWTIIWFRLARIWPQTWTPIMSRTMQVTPRGIVLQRY